MQEYVIQVIGSLEDVEFVEARAMSLLHFIGNVAFVDNVVYHFMLSQVTSDRGRPIISITEQPGQEYL